MISEKLNLSMADLVSDIGDFARVNVSDALELLKYSNDEVPLKWSDEALKEFERGLRFLFHWRDLLLLLDGGVSLSDVDFWEYAERCQNVIFDYVLGRGLSSKKVEEFWSSFDRCDLRLG
jgi:hypothetical protein